MIRWVVTSVWLWAGLAAWAALQQPAAAHARAATGPELGPAAAMCGDGSQTVRPEQLAPGRALVRGLSTDERAPAPEHAGSPSAAESGASYVVQSAAPSSSATPARTRASELVADDDGSTAWCISPDDPRCAPRDQGAPVHGQRAHVSVQDVGSGTVPELLARSIQATWWPAQLGSPRAGARLQLERPPRS